MIIIHVDYCSIMSPGLTYLQAAL